MKIKLDDLMTASSGGEGIINGALKSKDGVLLDNGPHKVAQSDSHGRAFESAENAGEARDRASAHQKLRGIWFPTTFIPPLHHRVHMVKRGECRKGRGGMFISRTPSSGCVVVWGTANILDL